MATGRRTLAVRAGCVAGVIVVAVAAGFTAPAAEAHAGAGAAAQPIAGRPATRCVVADQRLGQISGLVERPGGFSVVNDTGPVIWRLDHSCRVTRRTVLKPPAAHDPAAAPLGGKRFDTEDLALDGSGAFWIADIGGNTTRRTAVSLFRWRVGTPATAVTRYDLRYPDGPHDAEALLLSRSGRVAIVTKTIEAPGVYVADAPLRPSGTLRLAGRLHVRRWCPSCRYRSRLVTGGAVSPDGKRVVLRTYDRAFEWDAPTGDVLRAMVSETPRQIVLPESRQGEAIAYTHNADTLLTATERIPAPIAAVPLRR
ncbi:hypothetical protein [Cryptosporangium sp. NPDC051539]|uniref:hypothetical protein n=1 Tax=Cryptosporangium sp. NPDC051539 TaxID=3363962 RepID=UPI00378E7991